MLSVLTQFQREFILPSSQIVKSSLKIHNATFILKERKTQQEAMLFPLLNNHHKDKNNSIKYFTDYENENAQKYRK